jgi:hypothetical protein
MRMRQSACPAGRAVACRSRRSSPRAATSGPAGQRQETRQRPDRRRLRRPQLADRRRLGRVPRRHAPRAAQPHRLRPPVRTPDVPGHAERAEGRVRPHHHRRRRPQQRLDPSRLHQLHRDRARIEHRADPVARSGPHEDPGLQPGHAEEPAGRGQGRDPRQREEPALRRLHVDRHQPAGLPEVGEQPRRLRQLRRPRRRQPGRRARLPPRLLRPEQRGAGDRRRRDPGPGLRAGPEILRRHRRASDPERRPTSRKA